MKPLHVISDRDNVGTALEALDAGREVTAGSANLVVREAIPRGHKVAIRAISCGDSVVKYGSAIGVASEDIPAGAHVHTHNVSSTRGRGDLAAADAEESDLRLAEPSDRLAEPH